MGCFNWVSFYFAGKSFYVRRRGGAGYRRRRPDRLLRRAPVAGAAGAAHGPHGSKARRPHRPADDQRQGGVRLQRLHVQKGHYLFQFSSPPPP